MAQAQIENRQEEEAQKKKDAKKRRLMTGLMLAGALGGHGAAAILKSPTATAITGGLNTAGLSQATGTSNAATIQEIAKIGATTAAGAAGAGAGTGGGFMSGLSTFGQGALSGITGGSSAAGTGGAAGALGTTGNILGRIGTSMLMNEASGGGNEGAAQSAMGAIGSYLQESQAANKSTRILEGTLKDPMVREALYPGVKQEQVDALLKYKDAAFGTIEGAQFLQQALPMLSRTSASNVDFSRQMQMQNLRNAPDYARIQASQKLPIDISGMATGLKGAIATPAPVSTTPAPMPGSELDLPGAVGKLESFMIQKYGPDYKAKRISPTQKDIDEFNMQ